MTQARNQVGHRTVNQFASSNRGKKGGCVGFAAAPSGYCLCPICGQTLTHYIGVPCYQKKCPKCGTPMTRG